MAHERNWPEKKITEMLRDPEAFEKEYVLVSKI
jgi:hypothetical protein